MKVAPLPRINRPEPPRSLEIRHFLRPPTGSVQGFLGGGAWLVIWGVLWLLLILALAGRFQWAQAALSQSVNRSASVIPESSSCQPGFIELDGRCVLGEEIVVRPASVLRKP